MNSSELPALTGDLPSYIAGVPVESSDVVEVFDPYSNQRVGSVANVIVSRFLKKLASCWPAALKNSPS